MKKYLITGGIGFIGSHLSEALLKLGNEVVAIDDFSANAIEKIDSKIKIYKTGIENTGRIKEIFRKEKPDIVYHLAGVINLRRQIADPLFAKDLNFLRRIETILDACQKNRVKKIIFISSGGAIYENARMIPTPQDYPAHPVSLYGLANLILEKYIRSYCKEYGMD
ncbi:MAG: NAD-dependent epimerase/dehydratase family protein, partial [Nanoarchaeota archaeon]